MRHGLIVSCALSVTLTVLLSCTDTLSIDSQQAGDAAADKLTAQEGKDLAPEPASKIVSLNKSKNSDAASNNKIALGEKFMAVTANKHATDAAYAILAEGGTAIDAAVAAQAVLGLVEPQSSGLGGGGFILYWDAKSQTLASYDGRETAPAAADENLFFNPDSETPNGFFEAVIGGKSVGVPGIVKVLDKIHGRHGLAPWSSLFDNAIGLSKNGFAVSQRLNRLITFVPKINERAEMAGYLFDQAGKPLAIGHILKNPAYAKTLEDLAEQGADIFYTGALADKMIAASNNDKNPGQLSRQDFAQYQAKQRPAVCSEVFSYKVCGMGPPSSGGSTVLAILGILDSLEANSSFNKANYSGLENEVSIAHQFIEASRLAFADRNTYIADPDFVDVPIQALLDAAYLSSRAQLIDPNRVMDSVQAGKLPIKNANHFLVQSSPELMSTTHVSIVDRYGNALSMTSSIETAFGSRLMVDGFILNNQLTDFSFTPYLEDKTRIANRVEGGKRPRSSMSPMIVFDQSDQPVLIIGSPGGKKIIGYVARVLYELLAFDRSVAESIESPHLFHMGSRLELEDSSSEQLREALRALGHKPSIKAQTSGLHAIYKQDGKWLGIADPRREGTALGR